MKEKPQGKQRLAVIESPIYSDLIFQVALKNNYAQKIYDYSGKKKSASVISRQLDILEREEGFLKSETKEDKTVFPMQKLRVYSVNWNKIVREFIRYVEKNIEYVLSENKRLGMNLDKIIKGFNERIEKSKDKKFQEDLCKNSYLQIFFEEYYSEIARLKERWTITATFDFLSFFGNLNFIYQWGSSHDFYNIEKVFYILNQSESTFPEWIGTEEEPKTKEERLERSEKIHKHINTEFKSLEGKRENQLKEILDNHKELVELYILDRILQIIKIKPSLQLGLNNATNETGKAIFKNIIDKDQVKKYFELRKQYNINQ